MDRVRKLLRENWLILLVVGAIAVAFLALRTTGLSLIHI